MRKGLIALFLFLGSLTAFAQRPNDDRTPEQRAEMQTKSLTKNLNLSEEQQKKVYALNLERSKQMAEMRNSQDRDRDKMRASMETYNTELQKLLTPEQKESYKKMTEERRSRGGRGGNGPGENN